MGLITTAFASFNSTLADQWKEYFVCSALDNDTLLIKGERKGKNSLFSGNNASDNVISNGSGIVVADGQCMILVDQGKVREVCSEPGCYVYDASSEPSIFVGNLSEAFQNLLKSLKERITYGGEVPQDQRVYYVNTKEIVNNKFGTSSPVSFRVVDKRMNMDLDVGVRVNGLYSYRIANPVAFYESLAGNVSYRYSREELNDQLRAEFVSALQPALAALSEKEIRPSALPAHTAELTEALNAALSEKWTALRGLEVISVALNPITLTEEDEALIKNAQKNYMYAANPDMVATDLATAKAEAMKDAARNPNGAVIGMAGVNMIGGTNDNSLEALYANKKEVKADTWTCECGSVNDGNFCPKCGKARPEGRYCPHCGASLPADAAFCPKCGKAL